MDVIVRVNRTVVHATCRFTDTSNIFEGDAEVGSGRCLISDADGRRYLGTGQVTSAANIAKDGPGHGNTSIACRAVVPG